MGLLRYSQRYRAAFSFCARAEAAYLHRQAAQRRQGWQAHDKIRNRLDRAAASARKR